MNINWTTYGADKALLFGDKHFRKPKKADLFRVFGELILVHLPRIIGKIVM